MSAPSPLNWTVMNQEPGVAERIREQLSRVAHLRESSHAAGLSSAVHEIKRLQARRFRATYMDFFQNRRYARACQFFLNELYGEHEFAERDAQFGRIAGAIERMFPEAVGNLAVDLAETHALTESLDQSMAMAWFEQEKDLNDAERYVRCWRLTGQPEERMRQLAVVQHMGRELQRLTRKRALFVSLKLMRQPAHVAGLSSLQQFLERGFSAFAEMGDASEFLQVINQREQKWIEDLFSSGLAPCSEALAHELLKT
jgi:hypothetical protein